MPPKAGSVVIAEGKGRERNKPANGLLPISWSSDNGSHLFVDSVNEASGGSSSFDPQDQGELVVHLQPVVLHPMFDPGSGPATFLAMGEDLAVKPGMKPSAQERQDVLGREVHRGVIEQPRVETSQRLTAVSVR